MKEQATEGITKGLGVYEGERNREERREEGGVRGRGMGSGGRGIERERERVVRGRIREEEKG